MSINYNEVYFKEKNFKIIPNKILNILIVFGLFINAISANNHDSNITSNTNNTNNKGLVNSIKENSLILELNEDNFIEKISQIDCALIQFMVSWCKFCKDLKPKFELAANLLKGEDNPSIKLFTINAENNKNVSDFYNILSYPTLKLYNEKNVNLTDFEGSKNTGHDIAIQMKKLCNKRIIEYKSFTKIIEDVQKYLNLVVLFAYKSDIEKKISNKGSLYDYYNILTDLSYLHNDLIFILCPLENIDCNPNEILVRNFNNINNSSLHEIYNSLSASFLASNATYEFKKLIFFKQQMFEQPKIINDSTEVIKPILIDFDNYEYPSDINASLDNLQLKINYLLNTNAYDLINKLEDRTAEMIFNPNITSMFYFRNSTSVFTKYDKVLEKVAKKLKGKLFFLIVDIQSELESRLADLLFIEPEELPQLRIVFTLNEEEIRTYLLDFNFNNANEDFTEDVIIDFYEKYMKKELKPYYKSEPVPNSEEEIKNNNGKFYIKKVVGSTYNDLVYDIDKNRLIKIYLPWDFFCKKLRPVYEELAEKFKNYDDLVFTELDFSKNEVPNNFIKAYPIIYFFPKGEIRPKLYVGDRTFESLEDFILINMSLPPVNRNNNDPNYHEEQAPTQPVEEFFRVKKKEDPNLYSENSNNFKEFNNEEIVSDKNGKNEDL